MTVLERSRIAAFSDSLGRCHARPEFLTKFYERLIGASPEVAEKFRNTDLDKQRRALSASLYAMVLAMEGGQAASVYLDRVARQHGRGELDIPPHLYELWLECLIEAVRECDPQFSDETERLWRDAMAFGVQFMKARY